MRFFGIPIKNLLNANAKPFILTGAKITFGVFKTESTLFIKNVIAQYQSWLNWGFWDYFWLTIIFGTIVYVHYRAHKNSKKVN
ncbi:hypothetical protein COT93_00770 [Candidatus Falkowbacteria bacterium CG10_big_fil_rev_8_21_14_0_10_37_18]|uniref:Uncharacterized protein n=1 Tax=Candidatus Falkowbacteria bacterium CG10_big_fil_rev_8_21_14_0_10_37_18 TaxID=1974562 RepID=A0A2H0V9J7_9BACT|nr:MAG: hypothetical protein AUJ26_00255 [Candidatus Falkowbacteria bacterium CG1_02_37_21]PIR95733.1 MAG: hypothetical protein COT93_00770 [Candidatus Falkowbacteria bacterium CG10_big_fil_rev_8_21_14_0_10_37_18]